MSRPESSGVTRAEAIAAEVADNLSGLKPGEFRIWGIWLGGRPEEIIHRVAACSARDNLLQLTLNEDEVISVWSPQHAELSDDAFRIQDAARVRWQWCSYGSAKVHANRYFEDFVKTEGRVELAMYFPSSISLHSLNPRPDEAAVEMFFV